jgi:hypothetical protein
MPRLNRGRKPPSSDGSGMWEFPVAPKVMLRAMTEEALKQQIFEWRLRNGQPVGDIEREIERVQRGAGRSRPERRAAAAARDDGDAYCSLGGDGRSRDASRRLFSVRQGRCRGARVRLSRLPEERQLARWLFELHAVHERRAAFPAANEENDAGWKPAWLSRTWARQSNSGALARNRDADFR